MLALPASLLIVAALLGSVTATSYCQCENPSHDRVFPGIQQVCDEPEMADGWCSTNCNAFGANCDYCQWVPAGDVDQAGFDRLKTWCSQQSGSDFSSGTTYYGTDVFCYSNANKASCSTCTGCAYHDNPTHKRSLEMSSYGEFGRRQESSGNAPQASVTLDVEPTEGEGAVQRECMALFPEAAQDMTNVLTEDEQCQMNSDEDSNYTIVCTGLEGSADGMFGRFSELCENYGGQEQNGAELKRAADVRVLFVG